MHLFGCLDEELVNTLCVKFQTFVILKNLVPLTVGVD
jgi:hypothetical protein